MGSVGFSEIAFIAVLALFVLGPDRLPAAARSIGKAVAEFRRLTSGARTELEQALDASGMRDTLAEIRGTVDEMNPRRVVTDALRSVEPSNNGSVAAVGASASAAVTASRIPPPDADVADADGADASRAPSHQIHNNAVAAPLLSGRFHDVLMDEAPPASQPAIDSSAADESGSGR